MLEILKTIRANLEREGRLLTREEAVAAASILLLCNGHDLDTWTDGAWPDDDTMAALAALAKPG